MHTKKNLPKYLTPPILLFGLALTAPLITPTSVYAAESGCSTAILKGFCNGNGISELLLLLINILAGGIGLIAVGGFIWAAILWTSAEDNASQITKSKGIITNTVIGLIGFGVFYSFLQFIIPGGLGSQLNNLQQSETAAHTQALKNSHSSTPSQSNENRVDTTATYVFQNLGRKEPSAVAVFQDIRNTFKDRSNVVYNFVEIDEGQEPDERGPLKQVFGNDGWSQFTTREPTLNKLNTDEWKETGSDSVYLHGNGSPADNCASPPRQLTITKFMREKSSATKLAVINTHFINHAYNIAHPNAFCVKQWDTAWAKLRTTVGTLHDNDYDIVITADFNRHGDLPYQQLSANAHSIFQNGPDHILAIPAEGRKITDISTGELRTPSGESFHGAPWAKLTFTGGGSRAPHDTITAGATSTFNPGQVLVIGDSITARGLEKNYPKTWWEYLLDGKKGMFKISAEGGSGYLRHGLHAGTNFADRLNAVTPSIKAIIIEGGINDRYYYRIGQTKTLKDAIAHYYDQLAQKLKQSNIPPSNVYVFEARPTFVDQEKANQVVMSFVRENVQRIGAVFVDTDSYSRQEMYDSLHPNAAGGKTITDSFLQNSNFGKRLR